jgi:lysophospholipase L1-like esterase
MFKEYPSNSPLGTGHNHILQFDSPRRLTARVYMRCLSYEADTWRFWFSNGVDSTFGGLGACEAYRDQAGGQWTILSARIGDGGLCQEGFMAAPAAVSGWVPVTFDGLPGRAVAPRERFWSDEVRLALPEGHWLVWEWELEGNGIPCTPDSQAATFVAYGDRRLGFDGGDLAFDLMCPMPDRFGARRAVKGHVAFWGDSITQGCGTGNNLYGMWAGRIALALGREYGCWNLGLGWARGSDAADGQLWAYKAAQNDVVCIAHGVNDILSGRYGGERGDTAREVLATLRKNIGMLKSRGIRVILFTIPPFDYTPEAYGVWRALRDAYPPLAEELGVELFDFSAVLDSDPPYGNRCPYGAHPNAEGGRVVAEAFLAAGMV